MSRGGKDDIPEGQTVAKTLTPLHIACQKGYTPIVKLLMEKQPRFVIVSQNVALMWRITLLEISLVEHQGTLYSIISLVEHQGTLYSIISLVEHQGTVEVSSSYPEFVLTGVTKY